MKICLIDVDGSVWFTVLEHDEEGENDGKSD